MNDPLNFDIDGLAARCELHPDRRDVFVEGEQDRGLMRNFLENHHRKDISVFPISVVNISPHLLFERSLPHPSRRSEVITLAIELESRRVLPDQVICIADADFHYLIPEKVTCSLLVWTDFASMELYAFSDGAVHSVLINASPISNTTGQTILADLASPLQELFTIRAANLDLKLGLEWIENLDKFFGVRNGHIEFDEQEFLKRYLVQRVPSELVAQFQIRLHDLRSILSSDVRCMIRGHDFIKVFTWYLRSIEKRKHLNEDSVRQMLYVALRMDQLAAEPMFRSVINRLKP